jgi:4-hydroxyphenylpyruvate dioxygenase
MITSMATVCISGTLSEKFEAISRAGFDGVEIFEPDFLASGQSPREVGAMARDHGLSITLYQPFRDYEGNPGKSHHRALERARRKFDVMTEMGAELLLVCSNTSATALGGIDRAAADLNELGELAARMGKKVGYEALSWGRYVFDHREAWEAVRRADHASVGLVLDSFHTLARRIDPDTIRSIPGDRIFLVQLADAPQIEMNLVHWSRHFRSMPGDGDLPVLDFMRAVAATGYRGPISIEVFNDRFRGAPPRDTAMDGQRSLRQLMDDVQRLEPECKLETPAMPPRSEVSAIAFVEFATDSRGGRSLGERLGTLGFAKVGQHRSKAIELYAQGAARLVINAEPSGGAHTSFARHGTTACALGLAVTSAHDSVKRAAALLGEGASGSTLPTAQGAGGGLVHFIDQSLNLRDIWSTEFSLTAAGSTEPCGIESVDHVAQTTSYEKMLSWSLFYRSVFEARRTPIVDVLDPSGLVQSQAIENQEGTFRVTLNGVDSDQTLAGRMLANTSGAGIQHIAFATRDMFATALALRQRGFVSLRIAPSYYDDLAARFDLAEAQLDRMRELNILYDEDETGKLLQLYSEGLDGGIFFEIVERRGSYQGYGAANAPIRIAAQRRAMNYDQAT